MGNVEFEIEKSKYGLNVVSTADDNDEIVQGLFLSFRYFLQNVVIYVWCYFMCVKNAYPII